MFAEARLLITKIFYCSLSTTMQSISTTFVTPTPIYTTYPTSTPPTVSPKSKCAKRAKALSADQACSGGVDYYTDILKNGSVGKDLARMAELHSYLCSSQRCFNKYVKTYRACLIALSGPERDFSVRICTFWGILNGVVYIQNFAFETIKDSSCYAFALVSSKNVCTVMDRKSDI